MLFLSTRLPVLNYATVRVTQTICISPRVEEKVRILCNAITMFFLTKRLLVLHYQATVPGTQPTHNRQLRSYHN